MRACSRVRAPQCAWRGVHAACARACCREGEQQQLLERLIFNPAEFTPSEFHASVQNATKDRSRAPPALAPAVRCYRLPQRCIAKRPLPAVSVKLRHSASVARETVKLRASITPDIAAQLKAASAAIAAADARQAEEAAAGKTTSVRAAVAALFSRLLQVPQITRLTCFRAGPTGCYRRSKPMHIPHSVRRRRPAFWLRHDWKSRAGAGRSADAAKRARPARGRRSLPRRRPSAAASTAQAVSCATRCSPSLRCSAAMSPSAPRSATAAPFASLFTLRPHPSCRRRVASASAPRW